MRWVRKGLFVGGLACCIFAIMLGFWRLWFLVGWQITTVVASVFWLLISWIGEMGVKILIINRAFVEVHSQP